MYNFHITIESYILPRQNKIILFLSFFCRMTLLIVQICFILVLYFVIQFFSRLSLFSHMVVVLVAAPYIHVIGQWQAYLAQPHFRPFLRSFYCVFYPTPFVHMLALVVADRCTHGIGRWHIDSAHIFPSSPFSFILVRGMSYLRMYIPSSHFFRASVFVGFSIMPVFIRVTYTLFQYFSYRDPCVPLLLYLINHYFIFYGSILL